MSVLYPLPEPTPEAAALRPGSVVGGFVIDAVVSHGPFAIVYRATDPLLQRPRALKEHFPRSLLRRRADGALVAADGAPAARLAAARQAFLDEARLLARLRIPGLLQVDAVFEGQGTVYRVMPWHDAPTLAEARNARERPDAAGLQQLVGGLLAPLQALHAQGLCHGAVAADQVLWDTDAAPLLLGFGSVRRVLRTPPEPPVAAGTDLAAVAGLVQFVVEPARAPKPVDPVQPSASDPQAVTAAMEPKADEAAEEAAVRAAIATMLKDIPPLPPRPPAARTGGAKAAVPAQTKSAPAPLPTMPAAPLPRATEQPPESVGSPSLDTVVPAAMASTLERPAPPSLLGDARPAPARAAPMRPAWRWALLLPLGLVAAAVAWQWQEGALRGAPARPTVADAAATVDRVAAAPPPAVARPQAPAVAPSASPASATPVHEPLPPPDLDRLPPTSSGVPVTTVAKGEEVVPVRPKRASATPAAPSNPRDACGARTNFSLFKCMQTQCDKPRFAGHQQCRTLRETGEPG